MLALRGLEDDAGAHVAQCIGDTATSTDWPLGIEKRRRADGHWRIAEAWLEPILGDERVLRLCREDDRALERGALRADGRGVCQIADVDRGAEQFALC